MFQDHYTLETQKISFMKNSGRIILNIATIISITIVTFKLALAGWLQLEFVAGILIFCVFILAVRSKWIKLGTAILSLLLFVQFRSQGNPQRFDQILQAILTLIIVLIGFYILFGGFRRRK